MEEVGGLHLWHPGACFRTRLGGDGGGKEGLPYREEILEERAEYQCMYWCHCCYLLDWFLQVGL